jgi:hypothetical protein
MVCLPSAEPTTYPNKKNSILQIAYEFIYIHRGNRHKEICRGGMEVNTATVKLSHFLTAPYSCSETALFSSSTLNRLWNYSLLSTISVNRLCKCSLFSVSPTQMLWNCFVFSASSVQMLLTKCVTWLTLPAEVTALPRELMKKCEVFSLPCNERSTPSS